MTVSGVLVAAPWIIVGVALAVVYIMLLRSRRGCRRTQLWRRWTPMSSRHTSSSALLTGSAANAKTLPDRRQ
jgi:hypothetical protein